MLVDLVDRRCALCKVRYYRLADDVPQPDDSLVEAEPGALDAGVPTSAIALLPHGCSRDRSLLQVMPFSLASGWTPHPCLPGTLLAVKLLPQPLEATRHDSSDQALSYQLPGIMQGPGCHMHV